MKTAMQEYIQDAFEGEIKPYSYYLEKEKQQIMDAFVSGDERGTGNIPFNCEQYFSQTYNTKKGK